MLFYLPLDGLRVFRLRIEDDIATGDERLHIGETNGFKQTAEIIHLHRVATNIYRAQERYVLWHA